MDVSIIVKSAISIAILGIGFGILLGVASIVFHVDQDPRVDEIMEVIPGANCGGCGFPGCGGLATAIVEGKAPVNACPVGGAKVAAQIAAIMGVEAGASERQAAFIKCKGTCSVAKEKYDYVGISDCTMAAQLAGKGSKGCTYGCMGLGSCQKVCMFDAIELVDGIAVVNSDKCTACKKCIAACPKGLIELVPVKSEVRVACNSHDKGKEVMANCSVGCISCKICQKNCPEGAITIENDLAHIDYDKCTGCGICAAKCPKKTILNPNAPAPKAEPVSAPADQPNPSAPVQGAAIEASLSKEKDEKKA